MTRTKDDHFKQVWKKCRRALLGAGFFSLFVNLLQLVIPLYMMQVFDRVLASGSMPTLVYLSLIAVTALVAMAALDMVRSRIANRAGSWFESTLAAPVFTTGLNRSLDRRQAPADATRDLGTVRGFLTSPGLFSLLDAPWVPPYLLVVFVLHPVLGAVATAGAVVLVVLALLNELLTRKLLREASGVQREAANRATAVLRHPEAVDAMGMTPAVARRWATLNDSALDIHGRATDRSALISAISKFVRMGVQLAILGVGAALVVNQELTAGAMIAGSILMGRALAPVEQAIGGWKTLIMAQQSLERLRDLFKDAPQRGEGMTLPAPRGDLAVENVSLTFPSTKRPVLKGVSFALDAGTALAVTGPSAAGKSALARLIIGTWKPSTGVVRLDGGDVYAWDRTQFGRHVGYLPQDIELYGGTVRENIARMDPMADPMAVVEAAKIADCHDMILRLPEGYDTQVGEAGVVLSGGQRQRIALARAVYGNPRLVVLDEPDSNLDRAGEESLLRAIKNMKDRGATVLVIAHRSGVLKVVDKVLLLRDGEVEMFEHAARAFGRMAAGIAERAASAPANDEPAAAPGAASGAAIGSDPAAAITGRPVPATVRRISGAA
ncbi:type I secretion system permease/ATPase [Novispirillum sp. DQ9]|uniref:type I secretion system permease/ATPase n=1 Tax=Novispirillum sp. DQ9 TaxID=3398612 RepID=UPI003C7D34A1